MADAVPRNDDIENRGVLEDTLSTVGANSIGGVGKEVADGIHFTQEEEDRVMRKVKWRVSPILGALYAVALIDRTNISQGFIANQGKMARVLHLAGKGAGNHYQVALLVFFIPLILLEIPSQAGLKKIGPKVWLSTITLFWGAVMIGQGFVTSWKLLAMTRALCGAFEAGFFPGAVWLLSTWFTRKEVALQMTIFYILSVFAAAFAAILGYGFTLMQGLAGLSGWQWLFIMEGILTGVLALIGYLVIDDFPDSAKWLTERERQIVLARVERDRGDANPENITIRKIFTYAQDLKVWGFAVCFLCATMPSYAFAFFVPIVVIGLGYSTAATFCLVAPAYLCACVVSLVFAIVAGRYNVRAHLIAAGGLLTIVGLAMMFNESIPVRLAGTFFGIAGSAANICIVLAYQASNVVGYAKKGFSSAILIAFGGTGGLIASVVFKSSDSPRYETGLWATMAIQIVLMVTLAVMSASFVWLNRQAREGKRILEGRLGFYYTI